MNALQVDFGPHEWGRLTNGGAVFEYRKRHYNVGCLMVLVMLAILALSYVTGSETAHPVHLALQALFALLFV